jgi:hypothetical protein
VGSGGTSGMVTDDSETFRLDYLEFEVVGGACIFMCMDWESDQLSFVFTTVATHTATLNGLSTGFHIYMCMA